MNFLQWREFLGELSAVILARDAASDDVNRPHFSPEIHAAGYVGFSGASEAQISAAEVRLGAKFPPSYRTFLSVSNGWPCVWDSVEPGKLWSTEEIRWAREQDPELIEIFGTNEEEISPEEHLNLREDGFSRYRGQYLQNLLCISEHGDACDLLLSPEVVDENGEWECWKISSWGGVGRWQIFDEWFRDVLEFHREND